jgi:hypothetical protein
MSSAITSIIFLRQIEDAPIWFRRQADYLVHPHRFARLPCHCAVRVQKPEQFHPLWINIDLATSCIAGYSQVCRKVLHQ